MASQLSSKGHIIPIRQIWGLHWRQGYSLNELAKRFNIPYSTLHYRLRRLALKIRPHAKSVRTKKTQSKYSDRSKGKNNPNYGKYGEEASAWKYGCREFYYWEAHRVWEKVHGPVPQGYVLHHIDKNPKNNDPSNLTIVTRSEHQKIHEAHKNLPHIKGEA